MVKQTRSVRKAHKAGLTGASGRVPSAKPAVSMFPVHMLEEGGLKKEPFSALRTDERIVRVIPFVHGSLETVGNEILVDVVEQSVCHSPVGVSRNLLFCGLLDPVGPGLRSL